MTDRNTKKRIQNSMDHALSGLPTDSFLTQRVLKRATQTKGEEKMKKKLSGSVIFAIVLTIVVATVAIAATNWDALRKYFETVRVMDTTGELARWSDEDKVKLLIAMEQAGLVDEEDARAKTALNESLPMPQRGSAANKIITERYGESYFDSYTVEQMEFPEDARSQDEQTAYEQWSEAYWSMESREKQPLTESRMYKATMNNLTEIGDFPHELLRDVKVSSQWNEQDQTYTITASIDKATYLAAKTNPQQISLFDSQSIGYENEDALQFQFLLDKYGTYLGTFDPNSAQSRAKLTLKEAQPIAEKALQVRLNVGPEVLKNLTMEGSFGEGSEYILEEGRFNAICFFIWREDGNPRYTVEIDAISSRVLKAIDWEESEAMEKKARQWLTEIEALLNDAGVSSDLTNAQGVYIWKWTLEERAAWSKVARPIVLEYLEEHPEFTRYLEDMLTGSHINNTWPNLISLTQYAYGTPDEASISQEKAFSIARGVALERGAIQSYVDENHNHSFYYDVTNPARPLWKVHISVLFGDGDESHPLHPTKPRGFFVVMDAHTGEVLKVTERNVGTGIQDLV